MKRRRGAVALGILLSLPLLASEVGAQRVVSETVRLDRERQHAVTDGARIAGQRWAEALGIVAAARSAGLGSAARLFGLTGLQAAAASVASPDALRYGRAMTSQTRSLVTTVAVPAKVLRELKGGLRDELGQLSRARGLPSLTVTPTLPTLELPGGMRACAALFERDPALSFSPGTVAQGVAATQAGTYLPWGPAAFAGAFGSAVATCAKGPLAGLASPPEAATFAVTLEVDGGLAGAVVEVAPTEPGTTRWRARLRHGDAVPAGLDPRLALIP